MRLIDADALMIQVTEEKREAPNWDYAVGYCDAIKRVECMIGEAPTVDPNDTFPEDSAKVYSARERRVCRGCGKKPEELPEYVQMVENGEFTSPTLAVIQGEGTYNPKTGKFWCTDCYIKAKCPANDF